MFASPKGFALFIGLLGTGAGVLLAVESWHHSSFLFSLLGGLIGIISGVGLLVWWRTAEAKGRGLSPGWFLVPPYLVALALALNLAACFAFATAGYGFCLWAGIHMRERNRGGRLTWLDLSPRQQR